MAFALPAALIASYAVYRYYFAPADAAGPAPPAAPPLQSGESPANQQPSRRATAAATAVQKQVPRSGMEGMTNEALRTKLLLLNKTGIVLV